MFNITLRSRQIAALKKVLVVLDEAIEKKKPYNVYICNELAVLGAHRTIDLFKKHKPTIRRYSEFYYHRNFSGTTVWWTPFTRNNEDMPTQFVNCNIQRSEFLRKLITILR